MTWYGIKLNGNAMGFASRSNSRAGCAFGGYFIPSMEFNAIEIR